MTINNFTPEFEQVNAEHEARITALRANKSLAGDIWAAQWRASFATRDAQEKELAAKWAAQFTL